MNSARTEPTFFRWSMKSASRRRAPVLPKWSVTSAENLFLRPGPGSGIHSLAAVRLGAARVASFDYDLKSVACTAEMKRRFAPMANWQVEAGSALDEQYLRSLAQFDVVYSWACSTIPAQCGKSLDLITIPAKEHLVICLYADQGAVSRLWRSLKRSYVADPWSCPAVTLASFITLWLPKLLLSPHHVISDWKNWKVKRGISAWHDIVDWPAVILSNLPNPRRLFPSIRNEALP